MTEKQFRIQSHKQGSYHGTKLTIVAYLVSILIALSLFSCSPKLKSEQYYIEQAKHRQSMAKGVKWYKRVMFVTIFVLYRLDKI